MTDTNALDRADHLYLATRKAFGDEIVEANLDAMKLLERLAADEDPKTVWKEVAESVFERDLKKARYVNRSAVMGDAYAAWERARARVLVNPYTPGSEWLWKMAERFIRSPGEAIPYGILADEMRLMYAPVSSASVGHVLAKLANHNDNDGWCPFRVQTARVAYGIREMRPGETKPERGWPRSVDSLPGA